MGNYSGGLSLARHAAYQTSRNLAQSAMRNSISLDMATKPKQFKPFTKRNCRANLIELTEIAPSRDVHAHHIFPQKYKQTFLDKGINIHDPKHMTWWEGNSHLPNAKGYNDAWLEFISKNPEVTPDKILDKGRQLMKKHGIEVNY